jgi:tRNA nucleotidyltransferase (CCA-adding enzyme)
VVRASPDSRGGGVLEALIGQPGGAELLALGSLGLEIALVGGAVRDLLCGRTPRELDIVVSADAAGLAAELAGLLGASASVHERFGTATVAWSGGRIDVAERRSETYPTPGALPVVRAGTIAEDLARRDFTVNAISVALDGPRRGVLLGAEHALEDLAAARLRVLHVRSFGDDPTRLMRLARYHARLGFELEAQTAALAAEALAAGALMTVSRARLGAELRLALAEADAPAALAAMGRIGVLAALPPGLRFARELAERALSLLPPDGRADLLLMSSLLLHLTLMPNEDPEPLIFAILDDLEFNAADRERALRSALAAPALVRALELAVKPSELHEALAAHTPEGVALAGALAGASGSRGAAAASEWFQRVRQVRLQINGADLLAAGVSAGPEIGLRLADALARKLDGELADGREAELDAALQARL